MPGVQDAAHAREGCEAQIVDASAAGAGANRLGRLFCCASFGFCSLQI